MLYHLTIRLNLYFEICKYFLKSHKYYLRCIVREFGKKALEKEYGKKKFTERFLNHDAYYSLNSSLTFAIEVGTYVKIPNKDNYLYLENNAGIIFYC